MPTNADYERKISQYDWEALQKLWAEIEAGNTPGWATGKAFEYLILRAFELENAQVKYPYSVKLHNQEIEQIDGVVYSDNLTALVECKDHLEAANIEPVAKMRNQLLRRPSTVIGVVFSYSGFTDAALTLAQFVAPQTILLWSGEEIRYTIGKKHMRQSLIKKYRHCVEYGLPNYNVIEEDVP